MIIARVVTLVCSSKYYDDDDDAYAMDEVFGDGNGGGRLFLCVSAVAHYFPATLGCRKIRVTLSRHSRRGSLLVRPDTEYPRGCIVSKDRRLRAVYSAFYDFLNLLTTGGAPGGYLLIEPLDEKEET